MSMVNHPKHYNSHPNGVEAIDIIEEMPFNVGTAMKYLWREGLKPGAGDDLEKAAWYIQREIDRRRKAKARTIAAFEPGVPGGNGGGTAVNGVCYPVASDGKKDTR